MGSPLSHLLIPGLGPVQLLGPAQERGQQECRVCEDRVFSCDPPDLVDGRLGQDGLGPRSTSPTLTAEAASNKKPGRPFLESVNLRVVVLTDEELQGIRIRRRCLHL